MTQTDHRVTTGGRKKFVVGGFLWAVIAVIVGAAPVLGDERPNIVFAFADDWGRYASAYGNLEPGGPNDVVSTPHFDRVAREGVLFTHAYVNAPSCTPCRSSLLSGQYFWRTGRGAILQGAIWDQAIPTYPLILKEHGYHIGHTWKVWSPGTPANAPYGAKKYAYNRRGSKFNRFSQYVSAADDPDRAKAQLLDEAAGNFRDFLADRKDGQPFCYWFGPTNCHRKWVQGSGKKLWGINPDDLKGKLPPFLPDVPVVREDFADYLGEVAAFDAGLGALLAELERIGELENTVVVVSGDHGIPGFPRGKCNLYDFGVAVSLAVRWGNQVPKGRVVDDFVSMCDLAPTFLDVAGVDVPEVMTGRSLKNVLVSTDQGLVDPENDHVIVGRERHVAMARTGFLPYPQRAIRTKRFLYVKNFEPERWPMGVGPGCGAPPEPFPSFEELREDTRVAFADLDASPTKAWIATHRDEPGGQKYFDYAFGRLPAAEFYDVQKDPHHMNNLADDPDFAEERAQLDRRLMNILKRTGDPRVTGDGDTFDKAPFSSPFRQQRRRKGA